jgi:tetratricopeptide (TPR) repeat protein
LSELRARLQATVREAAERERPLYGRLQETTRDAMGWTVKDHVAHLAAWRRDACELLGSARAGQPGRPISDLDARNAEIYEQHREWPAERVLEAAQESATALLAALEDLPPAALLSNRSGSESPLWVWVLGDGHEHVADHLAMLAAQQGDDAAAEAAHLWAHEVGTRLLAEPANVPRADYNLGCFYARTGRPDEAMPHLRRALAADPKLQAWAQQDPDLEGVRGLLP